MFDGLFAKHPTERLNVEIEALQGENGKKQPPLTFHKGSREAFGFAGSFFLENDKVTLDVGVFAHRVGVGVVFRVFSHPPRVTDSHNPIGEDARNVVVFATRGKHLPVGCFMGDEGKLGHDDRHQGRQSNLDPRVTEEKHSGKSRRKRHAQHDEQGHVVAHGAIQKLAVLDPAKKL